MNKILRIISIFLLVSNSHKFKGYFNSKFDNVFLNYLSYSNLLWIVKIEVIDPEPAEGLEIWCLLSKAFPPFVAKLLWMTGAKDSAGMSLTLNEVEG